MIGEMATSDLDRRRRFETLAAEVFDPLQRYLRRRAATHDAQDALGDVLLTIWRRLDQVPVENPLPWCYGVARLTVSNQRRSSGRRLRLTERLVAQRDTSPIEQRDDPALETALGSLSESERELLRLWAWEQLEPREIAVVLATTPNAVSLRLTRARKKLEMELRRQNHPLAGQDDGYGRKEPE